MKDMFDRRLFCDILRKNWFWFVLSFFAAITNLLHDEGKVLWSEETSVQPSMIVVLVGAFLVVWTLGRYFLGQSSRDVFETLPVSRKAYWGTAYVFLMLLGVWYFLWCYIGEADFYKEYTAQGMPAGWVFSRYFAVAILYVIAVAVAVIVLSGSTEGKTYILAGLMAMCLLLFACIYLTDGYGFEHSGGHTSTGEWKSEYTFYLCARKITTAVNVVIAAVLAAAAVVLTWLGRKAFLRRKPESGNGTGGWAEPLGIGCGMVIMLFLLEILIERTLEDAEPFFHVSSVKLVAVTALVITAITAGILWKTRQKNKTRNIWKGMGIALVILVSFNLVLIGMGYFN